MNNVKCHRSFSTVLLLVLALLFGACHHNEDVIEPDPVTPSSAKTLKLHTTSKVLGSLQGWYTLVAEVTVGDDGKDQNTNWTLSTDVDWISLSATEGSGNAILSFKVAENRSSSRYATITLADPDDPENRYELSLEQDEVGNSTLSGTMERKHAMGYGYNMALKYADDEAFSALPILDYDKIVALEKQEGMRYITENYRHAEKVNSFSGNTYTQLSRSYSETSNDDVIFWGSKSDIKEFHKNKKSVSQTCSYIRLCETVTSRTVDMGMIMAAEPSTVFADAFLQAVEQLPSNGAIDDAAVLEFINAYGTHFCVSADLGGYVSINALVNRDTLYTHEEITKSITKKRFFVEGSTETTHKVSDSYLEKLDPQYEFHCAGGSEDAQDDIIESLNNGNMPDLTAWQESLRDEEGALLTANLALVDLRTIPIYDLITDTHKRSHVRQVLLNELRRKGVDCSAMEDDKGYDTYGFSLENALDDDTYLAFGMEGENARLLLTREYVPSIRKDALVEVVYPVVNGRPYLTHGIFLGDKTHNPGDIRWFGDESTYEPDTIRASDARFADLFDSQSGKLKQVYYYFHDLHILPDAVLGKPDQNMTTFEPVTDRVKIGSMYWTRDAGDEQPASALTVSQLPSRAQFQSLTKIASFDMIDSESTETGLHLGLRWPKGFNRGTSSGDGIPVEGTENYIYLPLSQRNDNGQWELRVTRLSPSGSVPVYQVTTLCPVYQDNASQMLLTPVYCSTILKK